MKSISKMNKFLLGGGLTLLLVLGLVGQAWTATSDGTVASEQKISSTAGGFGSGLSFQDFFGAKITSIGDLDGDGVTDLAVGANGDGPGSGGGFGSGAVYILFMNADGTVKSKQKISNGTPNFGSPLGAGDSFSQVANIGDIDGDGVTDLVVGAPLDDDGFFDAGAVYIIFLNTDGTVKSVQKISDTQGNFGGFLSQQDQFGMSTAGIGDLNGDGNPDIAVGAITLLKGSVFVIFLNTDGTVKAAQKISATAGGFGGVIDYGDAFGKSVASIGDLDGDGVTDLAVGAVGDDDGIQDAGAVWILFMNTDGTVKSEQKISETQGGFTGTLDDADVFGSSAAGIGDLDGDGVPDLAVGAFLDDDGCPGGNPDCQRGAVWILFLNTDGTVKSEQKISDTEGNFGGVLDDGDFFSIGIANIGDLDGDGTTDLAVGASGDDDGIQDAGAVWILFLNRAILAVDIDIKPGSDLNSINLNSAGVIPVAILSSDTFDATTVDPYTVTLAGARIKMVGKSNKYLAHEEDVNGDGLLDMICQVETAFFMIETGESVVVLEGECLDGTTIRGEDDVSIVSDY